MAEFLAPTLPVLDADLIRDLRPRVLYTDLDGTMLGRGGSFFAGPDGEPSTEPAEALLAAREAGLGIVPTSGRALRGLMADGRILGLSTVIAEMGTLIAYDLGREFVRDFGATPGAPGEMPAETMRRTGAVDLLLDRYRGRLELHTPWSSWRECTQLLRGLADPTEADALLEREGHGWLTFQDNGMLTRPVLSLAPGTARVYHLMPRGVSKGSGVARDRSRNGLVRAECVAIGDAVADLTIAPEVGLLVLVRDAVERDPDLARRAAAFGNIAVTSRPMNLGWADTVRLLLGLPA